MATIKETKEAVDALLDLSLEIAKLSKDGVTLSDATLLFAKMQEEPLKSKLALAVENAKAIPSEVKDIQLSEAIELGLMAMPKIVKLAQEISKK